MSLNYAVINLHRHTINSSFNRLSYFTHYATRSIVLYRLFRFLFLSNNDKHDKLEHENHQTKMSEYKGCCNRKD